MFPEIVLLTETNYSILRYAYFIFPNLFSFIIAFKNSNPKLFSRNLKYFCKKFPRPFDRLSFKIISKGKVSQHFKISAMSCCFTNTLNIRRSDTFLTCCNSLIRRNSLSQEKLFKRCHTGIDQ